MNETVPVEFLYGIEAGHWEGNDDVWVPHRVVSFRITKKTPKRIYYVARDWGQPEIRFVDRQRLEADGEIWRRSAQWWEPDIRLYLNPPVIEQAVKPDLAELKAAMAAAHPDRGGSDTEFIAARQRYERARTAAEEITA